MSIALIEREIERFLNSPEPEVICIRGKWGVGKTHYWNEFLRSAKKRNAIALKSYAYVSLFGIASLDRLKYAIFENKLGTDSIGIEPSIETFKSNTGSVAKQMGMKTLSTVLSLPQSKSYASAFESVSFLSVKETLVCFDDLERKGDSLPMKDVMGLISNLREQKKCKVVLILNDDQLESGDAKGDFKQYNEKVIDASLLFEPDPRDCVELAVKGEGEFFDILRADVITLGISNIRVIRKIERLVSRVEPLLRGFHPRVLRQAVQSSTLFGWSIHSEGDAPTLEFILQQRSSGLFGTKTKEDMSDDEKNWNDRLDNFGFVVVDEFDLELLEGMRRGYFDEEKIVERARELHIVAESQEADGSLKTAWALYHDSFKDNQDEVVETLCEAHRQFMNIVTPARLHGVVNLLKELGSTAEATALIYDYIEQHEDSRDSFDLSNIPFSELISDPEFRDLFKQKYRSFVDERSPMEILFRMAKDQVWSSEDLTLLSKLSPDDLYVLFKEYEGGDLVSIVRSGLSFRNFSNADEMMKHIYKNAEQALVRIGQESKINKIRVQNIYKVEVTD